MERRFAALDGAEVKGNTLHGHAAVFNSETRIGDFYEYVAPSFFDRALREAQDTVLQADHAGLPLSRTRSGTLRLGKDSRGLAFEADLADTSLGRDVRELVDRGDLGDMSFGFTVAEDEWSVRADGSQLRGLVEVARLYDISVVTFPAYAGTDAALRSAAYGQVPVPPTIGARVSARMQAARIRFDLHMKGRDK